MIRLWGPKWQEFGAVPSSRLTEQHNLELLANRIHGGTPGLSTLPEAKERIGAIQRFLRTCSLSGVVTPWDSVRKMNWRSPVKPFSLLKMRMVLVGFGPLVIFARSCKAQSEVSPDHFDGTDAWEVAARKPLAPKAKAAAAPTVFEAMDKKASANASV